MASKSQLTPLTGIRFFLAIWVVVFHQPFFRGFEWMQPFPRPLPSLFHSGYLAVGMFFVLSGFVLSYNYPLEKQWSPTDLRRFAIARFARIYPAYAIGLVLSAPWVGLGLTNHRSLAAVGREFVKAVLAWSLLQAWVPQAASAWNSPAWSLSVEAFFYLSLPFVGLLLWRLSRTRSLLAAVVAICAAAMVVPLVAAALALRDIGGVPAALWDRSSAGDWVSFLKFNPLLHLPQFCMGILAGKMYFRIRDERPDLLGRGYLIYLPALALELAAIVRFQPTLYPFLHSGLLMPLYATVILGLALGGGPISNLLSTRLLVLMGNASYSIYIFHGVLADWILLIAKRIFHMEPIGMAATAVYLVVLIGFSTAVFRWVEEPANRWLKQYFRSRPGAPLADRAKVAAVAC